MIRIKEYNPNSTATATIINVEMENQGIDYSGVRLKYLLTEFVDEIAGGRDALENLSTAQVLKKIIIPTTSWIDSFSFCEYLTRTKNEGYGKKATVFCIHSHSMEFLTLLDSLEFWNREQNELNAQGHDNRHGGDPIIWLDIFSVNQHHRNFYDFDVGSSPYKSLIEEIGCTLLVLKNNTKPWDLSKAIPFDRSWCLLELYYTSIISDQEFQIAADPFHSEQLHQQVLNSSDSVLEMDQILQTSIQVKTARAQFLDDQVRIVDVFRKIDLSTIHSQITKLIQDWIVTRVKQALIKNVRDAWNYSQQDEIERVSLQQTLGCLYVEQKKFEQAEEILKDCLDERRRLLGNDHQETLTSLNYLGRLYKKQGRLKEAIVVFEKCFEQRIVSLGMNDPKTLQSAYHLATLSHKVGFYEKSKTLYKSCLQQQIDIFGEVHFETIATMQGLANLNVSLGKYNDAIKLFEKCIDYMIILGTSDIETLTTMHELGYAYYKEGLNHKALRLMKRCVNQRRSILGLHHSQTRQSVFLYAQIHHQKGNTDKALTLYAECWKACQTALGTSDDPETLEVMHKLGLLYQEEGNYERARPLFEAYFCQSKKILGPNHPKVLFAMHDLAKVFTSVSEYEKSFNLYSDYLKTRKDGDQDTLLIQECMVLVHCRNAEFETARSLLDNCLEAFKLQAEDRNLNLFLLDALHNLAMMIHEKESKFNEAATIYEMSLDLKRNFLGVSHPSCLETLVALTILYCSQGYWEKAEPLYEELLANIKKKGIDQGSVVESLLILAGLFTENRKHQQAEPLTRLYLQSVKSSKQMVNK